MELKCKLKSLQPVVERANFTSRKVWVITEENPEYPQTIEVELQQAKVNLLDNVQPGAPVTLHCNLRGREWTNPEGKTSVFNSIVVWKVEGVERSTGGYSAAMRNEAPDLPDDTSLPF